MAQLRWHPWHHGRWGRRSRRAPAHQHGPQEMGPWYTVKVYRTLMAKSWRVPGKRAVSWQTHHLSTKARRSTESMAHVAQFSWLIWFLRFVFPYLFPHVVGLRQCTTTSSACCGVSKCYLCCGHQVGQSVVDPRSKLNSAIWFKDS